MREIKFRAWDKVDKRMIINKQDFIPLMVTSHGVMKLDPKVEYEAWYFVERTSYRFELMQYTGLKDKNGKEIYEGDIVERRRERGLVDFNDRNFGGILGWNLLQYQYVPYEKEGWVYAEKGEYGRLPEIEFYYGCPPDKSWEVVGNIFEGVDK